MFSKFTEEAQKVLVIAKREMMELKHPYVGSEHLLLAILKNKTLDITKKLADYGLNYSVMRKEIIRLIGMGTDMNNWFLYTPLLKRILEGAMLEGKENSESEVSVEHLFLSLIEEGEGVAIRILLGLGIDIDELYQTFSTKVFKKSSKATKKLLLDDFAIDFNQRALKKELDPVVGRDMELTRLMEILSRRTKNNPMLIGEAGVGKTAIVEELSRLIVSDMVPEKLRGMRILSLSIAGLVAGTKYRGEFEERVNKLLREVEQNSDIILFVDEIHTLIGAGGAEGAIDASNILKPILARGKIRLMGATTTDEYKKFIEKDKAFARRFQTVLVEEPDSIKTLEILKKLKPLYEGYHHVTIDEELLGLLVSLSDRYLFDRKQPDKAIDLLDEVCAKVALMIDPNIEKLDNLREQLRLVEFEKNEFIVKQDFKSASELKEKEGHLQNKVNNLELKTSLKRDPRIVTKDFVLSLIQEKTKIPVFELTTNKSKYFSNLEINLKKEILGQDEVINSLCAEVRRIQFGLRQEKKPASFLLVGKTGVGKTKLVKEFAKNMVGEDHFIRLDMSEYREGHSISKIIGSPPGYVGYMEHNSVLENIRTYPYSVLLLDEIEKAHPSVVQLFLQALDEGKMKTSSGSVVRFDHVMIFMTSNIGFTKNELGFSEENRGSILSKLKELMSIEFINRIEHVLTFSPMTKEVVLSIINKEIQSVISFFKSKGIELVITKQVLDDILKLSEYQEFGARKVSHVIHQRIDTLVIDAIIEGKSRVKLKNCI